MNLNPKIAKPFMVLVLFSIMGQTLYAQMYDQRKSHWYRFRHEVGATVGFTAFLGELGGANAIGSDGLRDWNFNEKTIW